MAEKPVEKKAVKFIAYAPFTFKGKFQFKEKSYQIGDEFIPADNMTRDENFDTFRAVEKNKDPDKPRGLAFTEIGDVISTDAKEKNNPDAERYTYRHILPLKEA